MMSISAAWTFFILCTPLTVFQFVMLGNRKSTCSKNTSLYRLFVHFLHLNSAVNFHLYILASKKFRKEFGVLLYRLLQKPIPRNYQLSFSKSASSVNAMDAGSKRSTLTVTSAGEIKLLER